MITSIVQMKTRLTLTRPKDPELETAQRVRSIRVKSTAELEEEMMAKIPKFRARPLNKKVKFDCIMMNVNRMRRSYSTISFPSTLLQILEARTLPEIPRTTPQLPEFQVN